MQSYPSNINTRAEHVRYKSRASGRYHVSSTSELPLTLLPLPVLEAMEYERRLLLAAKLVLSSDLSDEGGRPPDPADIRITATVKPHQIEGVSWLIRRYHLGVNVILGGSPLDPSSTLPSFLTLLPC